MTGPNLPAPRDPAVEGQIVEMPSRKQLIIRGRAALAGLGYDPDDRVDAETEEMLRTARSADTTAALCWGWGRFIHWCGATSRRHDPPTHATIRQYIKDHWYMVKADGSKRGRYGRPYAPQTVELAVYTVAMVCNRLEWANPVRHPEVREQLIAYRIRYEDAGFRTDEADPMTPAHNVALARSQDLGTVNGLRNATMFRLQYDTGCRAGELCAVQMSDVRWESDQRLLVTFVAVKGRTRDKARRQVAVQALREADWDVDPVRLFRCWWDATRLAGFTEGPLFHRVNPGPRRLDFDQSGVLAGTILPDQILRKDYDAAFDRGVKKSGIALDPVTGKRVWHYTTHAERAGHITFGADAGIPLERMARRTGHNPGSRSLTRYYRSARQWDDDNPGVLIRRQAAGDGNADAQ